MDIETTPISLAIFETHEWINPVELAEEIRCEAANVRAWIKSGLLQAINTAAPTAKKPRWKINRVAWEYFARRRSNLTQQPASRRKAKAKVDLSEIFPQGYAQT